MTNVIAAPTKKKPLSTILPTHLSDRALLAEVVRLAGSVRETTAALVAHLAELYGRRLHEREGFSSLFTYCTDVLHLSDSEAYDRMKAAKIVRRYPMVLGLLESGRLNLTSVRLLAPYLTRHNHRELLDEACGKRKRGVMELLARRFPKEDVPSSVRKLPTACAKTIDAPVATIHSTPQVPSVGAIEDRNRLATQGSADAANAGGATVPSMPCPPHPVPVPLSPDRYQVTFTASAATREKLELAQDLLRHAIPDGDPAQVFARALDVLVEELVRQKFAVTERPRTRRGEPDDRTRHIPSEVKRAVYVRDCGRCAFVSPSGRQCGARGLVEFHHVRPYAAGGRPTVDNIELRCRAHNAYEAVVFFGPMKEYVPGVAMDGVSRQPRFRSGTKTKRSCTGNPVERDYRSPSTA
jgi:hypothetical protein